MLSNSIPSYVILYYIILYYLILSYLILSYFIFYFYSQFVDGADGRCRIAVEQYPIHTATRLSNGSWRIDNEFVWFEQIGTMDPDNIPLF